MIKQIFAALAGLALAVPGQARVEEGTVPLINLIEGRSGIVVQYNSDDCDSGEYLGIYRHSGMKRALYPLPWRGSRCT